MRRRPSGEPVTGDYPGDHPHTFTSGTIKRVAVDVSGELYVNLEREAQAMLDHNGVWHQAGSQPLRPR